MMIQDFIFISPQKDTTGTLDTTSNILSYSSAIIPDFVQSL